MVPHTIGQKMFKMYLKKLVFVMDLGGWPEMETGWGLGPELGGPKQRKLQGKS